MLAGIDAAAAPAFGALKIDTVVIRGVNDDELMPLIEYGRGVGRRGAVHRVHGRRRRDALVADAVVSRREMLDALGRALRRRSTPSAERRRLRPIASALPDGTTFGIISSTTEPFCANCDRSRLTADGVWLMCLYARAGTDLRRPLRAGATDEDLRS